MNFKKGDLVRVVSGSYDGKIVKILSNAPDEAGVVTVEVSSSPTLRPDGSVAPVWSDEYAFLNVEQLEALVQ